MSDEVKPFAWAVIGDGYEYATLLPEHAGAVAEEEGGIVVPLYRSPTLTDAERQVLEWAVEVSDSLAACGATGTGGEESHESATLRGLLDRLG